MDEESDGESLAAIADKAKLEVMQHRTSTAAFRIQDEHVNKAFDELYNLIISLCDHLKLADLKINAMQTGNNEPRSVKPNEYSTDEEVIERETNWILKRNKKKRKAPHTRASMFASLLANMLVNMFGVAHRRSSMLANMLGVAHRRTSMLANILAAAAQYSASLALRPSMSVLALGLAGSDEPSAEPNMFAGPKAGRPHTRASMFAANTVTNMLANMLARVWGA
ncbi:hypothetical protein GE061_012977 [Apolygus lucorum]|uniref:Uncharacterized protein n=1 Tax=Apolygus lucorum TaxID=248454 RepID=A0A6A4JM46_APOLU|nr:hypothetical protein GE061_012977 [Apolygus lucorum]